MALVLPGETHNVWLVQDLWMFKLTVVSAPIVVHHALTIDSPSFIRELTCIRWGHTDTLLATPVLAHLHRLR